VRPPSVAALALRALEVGSATALHNVGPSGGGSAVRSGVDARPLPRSFDRLALVEAGFQGWRTWAALRQTDLAEVPATPAVYVIVLPAAGSPRFAERSHGGRFKAKDPTMPTTVLAANRVSGTEVIFVGKADDAQRRLRQFARFVAGTPSATGADASSGSYGTLRLSSSPGTQSRGRRLPVPTSAPLARFAELHSGTRPFANLTG
jgi:hypothetical protein